MEGIKGILDTYSILFADIGKKNFNIWGDLCRTVINKYLRI
jgi:hypothetical protein